MTQASLRVAGALWALDPALAHQRQFPAVDWATSYILYADARGALVRARRAAPTGSTSGARRSSCCSADRELREIAGLVGPEALQDRDRLLLESARMVRELVLGQSAYDPNDAFSPLSKTYRLASARASRSHRRAAADRSSRADGSNQLDLGPARRALSAAPRCGHGGDRGANRRGRSGHRAGAGDGGRS